MFSKTSCFSIRNIIKDLLLLMNTTFFFLYLRCVTEKVILSFFFNRKENAPFSFVQVILFITKMCAFSVGAFDSKSKTFNVIFCEKQVIEKSTKKR
jgi:hypothetical protein